MPRGDRRGPAGMGPMTGRGLGDCTGGGSIGYGAGRGLGRGLGRGQGFGGGGFGRFGGGLGRGQGFRWNGFGAGLGVENENDVLDREITYMKAQLDSLQKRRDTIKDDD